MDEYRVVHFIRHGMTKNNKHKQYTGWSNPSLLTDEKRRLSKMANQLKVDVIWCSDLLRARQTACQLFPRNSIHDSTYFRELCFGAFEEKTYEELKHDKRYQHWISNPEMYAPPEGESLQVFKKRIIKGWNMLQDTSAKRLALITHAGWIREWCSLYAPEYPQELLWNIPYGRGFTGYFQEERGKWQCISLQEVPLTEKKRGY